MRNYWVSTIAITLSLSVQAAFKPVSPADQGPHVFAASNGHAISLPSQAAPSSLVAEFLRGQGRSLATIDSLVTQSEQPSKRTGVTHVRMSQQVAGLSVYDTYVKAAVNSNGEVVHLIENLAPVPGKVDRAVIGEAAALRAALNHLGIEASVRARHGQNANTMRFEPGSVFSEAPSVTRVAVPMSDGSMATGYVVTTWTRQGNLLYETLVDGHGRVLSSQQRTASDSYKVFLENPDSTAQSVEAGPGSGNDESPDGWLYPEPSDHTTVNISGNNVHAYLDTVDDGVPDGSGSDVDDGVFETSANLAGDPSEPDNMEVAVQNLFYHSNLIHDILYRAGFDEAAGNFQEDNFGTNARGDGDSVNAEAQDGGGTDNANFATPRDGRSPRMQMYLWASAAALLVTAPGGLGPYDVGTAEFGPALDETGVSGDVKLADDGSDGPIRGGGPPQPGSTSDGCESYGGNFFAGTIALVDRGGCTFVQKVGNAEAAGATAVIVVNNDTDNPDQVVYMGGTDDTITIPSVSVSYDDGQEIKGALGGTVTVTMKTSGPRRDGSLDTDLVYHEYGHGLTWRMIGRMDGAIPGAIGEGMSDVLASILNDDDIMAEYSSGDPDGLRSEAYGSYSRTYADFTGEEVHDDGEIYGAIGWRMWDLFQGTTNSLDADGVLAYLVDGMNYTPAAPSFEDMRDGILAAIANSGAGPAVVTEHQCVVWDAFAHFGVGVGSSGTMHGSNPVITESYDLPGVCPPP